MIYLFVSLAFIAVFKSDLIFSNSGGAVEPASVDKYRHFIRYGAILLVVLVCLAHIEILYLIIKW